jgi:hypothetical protein
MALTRDNHFVPQLYLKNFATPSGEVLEYRILVSRSSVPVWKRVNVAGTGYEKNLYTRIVRGEEADDIEQWLNRVLDQSLKDVEARLREARESGQRIVSHHAQHTEYFPMKIDRKDLPEEKKVRFTRKILVGRGLWFFTMKHILTNTLKVLYKHKWAILEAPASLGWFTSDDPVICLNFRSESDYDFNGGWNRARANILFPLSPRHLMFTEIGANSDPRQVPSRYHARLFRRMIAEHAHRRIYSLAEDGKIPQLKPRLVDAVAFQNERTLWGAWYEDQSRAEQPL